MIAILVVLWLLGWGATWLYCDAVYSIKQDGFRWLPFGFTMALLLLWWLAVLVSLGMCFFDLDEGFMSAPYQWTEDDLE